MSTGKDVCAYLGFVVFLANAGCTSPLPQPHAMSRGGVEGKAAPVRGGAAQGERQQPPPPIPPEPSTREPGRPSPPTDTPRPIARTPEPPNTVKPAGTAQPPNAVKPAGRDLGPSGNAVIPAITPDPTFNKSTGDGFAYIHRLRQQSVASYSAIDSYQARLRRREQVNGKNKPEEIVLFRFRKQPWSVYFKWIGKEGNGRELVYVKGQHGDKLHTLLADGDSMFMKAGTRFALSPDSPLIRSESRHSIHEAGMGYLIELFSQITDAVQRGDGSITMKYLGVVKRGDLTGPVEGVEIDMKPGVDPLLTKGGRRLWFFDTTNHLPVLLLTLDERGQEVEYYCYDRIQYPIRLDDRDFDPDVLWPVKK